MEGEHTAVEITMVELKHPDFRIVSPAERMSRTLPPNNDGGRLKQVAEAKPRLIT